MQLEEPVEVDPRDVGSDGWSLEFRVTEWEAGEFRDGRLVAIGSYTDYHFADSTIAHVLDWITSDRPGQRAFTEIWSITDDPQSAESPHPRTRRLLGGITWEHKTPLHITDPDELRRILELG